ncbi:MAG: hypothetical protein GWM88_15420 [Pseudomonadales bacterium]|nr:hypothetical protein [Pseudomonadales bacterium]NIX09327.1 hypothetical protein [Pseudomonadales bacterium]
MGVFEYVAGFVAIVVGLAVARVMGGIGAFILSERRAAMDWLLTGWCLALIVTLIGWWMLAWFRLGQLETITYGAVFEWFAGTALLYLASYMLVPSGGPASGGSGGELGILRPAFFVCLAAHFAANIVESAVTGSLVQAQGLVALMVMLSATGAFLRGPRAHGVLLLTWIVCMLVLNFVVVPAVGADSGSVLDAG